MSPLQETGDDSIQKFSVMTLLNNPKVRETGSGSSEQVNVLFDLLERLPPPSLSRNDMYV